jgi:hypothetical protein
MKGHTRKRLVQDGLWIAYFLNLLMGDANSDRKLLSRPGFHFLEGTMSGQNVRCTYCGEPLAFTALGVEALRTGNEFVCNEFCADGLSSISNDITKATACSNELRLSPP